MSLSCNPKVPKVYLTWTITTYLNTTFQVLLSIHDHGELEFRRVASLGEQVDVFTEFREARLREVLEIGG